MISCKSTFWNKGASKSDPGPKKAPQRMILGSKMGRIWKDFRRILERILDILVKL